jgi:hypothetical protein
MTSQPWGPSGVLCSSASDGSTEGIGSFRVPTCHLVPGLLLGDRSLAPFAVPCSRTRVLFAAASRLSYFLVSPNLSVVLDFLLMYLLEENHCSDLRARCFIFFVRVLSLSASAISGCRLFGAFSELSARLVLLTHPFR